MSEPLSFHQGVLRDPGYNLCPNIAPASRLIPRVQKRLIALGLINSSVPLTTLHQHLPPEAMALNEHYSNAVSRAFYATDDGIQSAYLDLIAHLYHHVVPGDFLFQAQPIVRFHFPVPFSPAMRTRNGLPRQLHSDILGGHPPRMIQGWMALCDCVRTAALQCSSREDGITLLQRYRDNLGPDDPPFADSLHHFYAAWDSIPGYGDALTAACQPVEMSAGDVLFFDPHCIHGGTENVEATTRVSMDFRMLPVAFEAETMASADTPTQKRFRRGELFNAQSAGELFG